MLGELKVNLKGIVINYSPSRRIKPDFLFLLEHKIFCSHSGYAVPIVKNICFCVLKKE